jgi:hypothetical protein
MHVEHKIRKYAMGDDASLSEREAVKKQAAACQLCRMVAEQRLALVRLLGFSALQRGARR